MSKCEHYAQVRRLPEPKPAITAREQGPSSIVVAPRKEEVKCEEKKQKQAAKKARQAQKR